MKGKIAVCEVGGEVLPNSNNLFDGPFLLGLLKNRAGDGYVPSVSTNLWSGKSRSYTGVVFQSHGFFSRIKRKSTRRSYYNLTMQMNNSYE